MSGINAASYLGLPSSLAVQDALGQNNTSTTGTNDVDKTEFLKLLVTQLQNQDPLNPVSNQDFIAQMATFSSLEQLMAINKAVTKLAGATDTTKTNTGDTGTNKISSL